ncbi:hypothetical protein [Ferrovibrio terrae]|uniref:hypothetical protein n=1 Tax=Ferrovibrio terrae TaxID=2594003 RepID=UPI003137A289
MSAVTLPGTTKFELPQSGVPVTGPIYGPKINYADWLTYITPEKVSGVLGHTFELPPPGVPVVNHTTGEEVTRWQMRKIADMDADERFRHSETRAGAIASRREALQNYDRVKSEIEDKLAGERKTRQELVEKLDSLPLDGEDRAMRDLLLGYIKRLDNSIRESQGRLERLEENFGPEGTYRKDIAHGLSEWMMSGTIYSEKLIDKVFGSKTVDEILENVGKLFLDLKKKLAELPADADPHARNETRQYALRVQTCFDSVKDRLKREFNWEGGDLDLSPAWFAGKTDGFDLAKELGYTDPMDIQDAFLAAIAGSDETWPDGVSRNPIDIIDHFLNRIESSIATTRGRLKPPTDDPAWLPSGWQDMGWIPIRDKPAAQTAPGYQGKITNPALINELAEAAE